MFTPVSLEVVLAMMLSTFNIEPSKDIGFEMSIVTKPKLQGSKDARHQLPVQLSLLEPHQ
jgi:hypothetical protein